MSGPDEMFDHEPPRANTVDEWIGRKPDNGTGELEQLRANIAAVLAIHRLVRDGDLFCWDCDGEWPCETARAAGAAS